MRVQGSLSGLRQVFHTRIEGVPVAGERADALAGMTGSGMDEQVLAVRVACGSLVPPPLGEHSFWRRVRALPSDHYLRIDPCGTVGELRWWHSPEPEVGLTMGADAVRQALETAVAARTSAKGRLSADLSGGLDSTSLCFLAARAGRADLLTFRWAEAEAALAVRPHERATPWRYKPLLVEAMRPILPEAIAARTTKGEFGEDVRIGFRRHLPEILGVFADSALANHGLIDPDLLRRELGVSLQLCKPRMVQDRPL
jgi:asparagine synthetase B (glutamine-hydrolysing)